jgi:hypothetical protein
VIDAAIGRAIRLCMEHPGQIHLLLTDVNGPDERQRPGKAYQVELRASGPCSVSG